MKGGALQKKKNDCLDERAKTKKTDVLLLCLHDVFLKILYGTDL